MSATLASEVRRLKETGKPTFSFPLFFGRHMDYQLAGAEFAYIVKRSLLMDPVGLGKTAQSLLLVSKLLEERRAGKRKTARVLIAVEGGLVEQWRSEIRAFLKIDALFADGTKDARRKRYENFASRDECIVLVNHSKLFVDFDHIQNFLRPTALIVDEAVILANKNKTHQHASWISRTTEFVCLLTAEPITRGDLVQIRNLFLVLGLNLCPSEEEFIDQFVVLERKTAYVKGRYGPYRRELFTPKGAKNLDKFKDIIYYNAIRRPESVLGDRRIINRQLITVEMSKLQRERYREIERKILTARDEKKELNAISTASYLSQVLCSPWLTDPDAPKESPKAEALARLAKHLLPEKLVVFSNWKRMHTLIQEEFTRQGISAVFYSGDYTEAENDAAVKSFKENPATQVIVMTKLGQKGLNLQVARNICLVDLLHSPSAIRQLLGRIDRIGQVARLLNFYLLVAEHSSEMNILRVLKNRQSVIDGVFEESKADLFDDSFSPEELLLAI
ncbi:DEAD/DEAH box helicase [Candidatus Parcubacteria bacterium]|nr:DEAD/DEAH box helicase [Candidatus Parcubacteria bacterium]